MTVRKAIIMLEGNDRKQENALHELKKFVDEANQEPEFEASIQTERIESDDGNLKATFTRADQ